MKVVDILREKCTKCGMCVKSCRRLLLSQKENREIALHDNIESMCVHCGNCVAACPGSAIVLDGLDPETLPRTFRPEINLDHLRMFMNSRRSVATFAKKPVPRELLQEAVSDTIYAPVSRSNRLLKWTVVGTPEKTHGVLMDALRFYEHSDDPVYHRHYENYQNGHDTLLRGAAALALVHAPAARWSEVDCATAVAYLGLALHARGLASVWAGNIVTAAQKQGLDSITLPEGHIVFAGLMIGYPGLAYVRLPYRPAPDIRYY